MMFPDVEVGHTEAMVGVSFSSCDIIKITWNSSSFSNECLPLHCLCLEKHQSTECLFTVTTVMTHELLVTSDESSLGLHEFACF